MSSQIAESVKREVDDLLTAGEVEKGFSLLLTVLYLSSNCSEYIEDLFVRTLCILGQIEENNNNLDKLFKLYQEGIKHYPNNKIIFSNLGAHLFRLNYIEESKFHFEKSLAIDKNYLPAFCNLQNIYNVLIPRWHFAMLNDLDRNANFELAIKQAIADGYKTVLDIGTGTGLLSLYAVENGAQKVYACDYSKTMINIATNIIKDAQSLDKIKLISKLSNDLIIPEDIPEKISLMVTETIDAGILGEHILQTIKHALENLLVDENLGKKSHYKLSLKCEGDTEEKNKTVQISRGLIIPSKLKMFAKVIECEYIRLKYKHRMFVKTSKSSSSYFCQDQMNNDSKVHASIDRNSEKEKVTHCNDLMRIAKSMVNNCHDLSNKHISDFEYFCKIKQKESVERNVVEHAFSDEIKNKNVPKKNRTKSLRYKEKACTSLFKTNGGKKTDIKTTINDINAFGLNTKKLKSYANAMNREQFLESIKEIKTAIDLEKEYIKIEFNARKDISSNYDCENFNYIPHKNLTDPIEILSINLNSLEQVNEVLDGVSHQFEAEYTDSGVPDAIIAWFEIDLYNGITISSSIKENNSWDQAVFPIFDDTFGSFLDISTIDFSCKNGLIKMDLLTKGCKNNERRSQDVKDIVTCNRDEILLNGLRESSVKINKSPIGHNQFIPLQFNVNGDLIEVVRSLSNKTDAIIRNIESKLETVRNILDMFSFPVVGMELLKRYSKSKLFYIEDEDFDSVVTSTLHASHICPIQYYSMSKEDINAELSRQVQFDVILINVVDKKGDFQNLQFLNDLRSCLSDNAVFLPFCINVHFQLIDCDWLDKKSRMSSEEDRYNISHHINQFQVNQLPDVDISNVPHTTLSSPILAHCFLTEDLLQCVSTVVNAIATSKGQINGISYWMTLDMAGEKIVKGRGIFYVYPHVFCNKGQNVVCKFEYDPGYMKISAEIQD